MSLQHFFLDNQDFSKSLEASEGEAVKLSLSPDDLKHAKVLRLKPGEHIGIIDSCGKFFEVEIAEASGTLKVKNAQKMDANNSKQNIWLAQGLSKGSKFDDIVRACTEIGVSGFIPVAFERSVSKLDAKKEESKTSRWQKIAKSASMQSGQFSIPKIYDVVDVKTLAEQLGDFDAVIICWEEADGLSQLRDVCEKLAGSDGQNIAVVIGPEGGITQAEVEALKNCNSNANVVSISNTILRTETAAIAACAITQFLLSC